MSEGICPCEVLDYRGVAIPSVLPGYRIIPDFPKYEINAEGIVRHRNVHKQRKPPKNGRYGLGLSREDGTVKYVNLTNLVKTLFPSD